MVLICEGFILRICVYYPKDCACWLGLKEAEKCASDCGTRIGIVATKGAKEPSTLLQFIPSSEASKRNIL